MTNSPKSSKHHFQILRTERNWKLLRHLPIKATKWVFFTDEKIHVIPPINIQNDHVWSRGNKVDVSKCCLLIERAKFAPHVMVSAAVCYGGKGWLHFIDEKAKVNAKYYVESLLPSLVADCSTLLPVASSFSKAAPLHTPHD